MATLSTGIPTCDRVLGGGIRRGSIVLLIGAPGTGKTMLAQQIAFNAVRNGERALFLTGYSETQDKLFAHSQGLAFFRTEVIGQEIMFGNLIDLLHSGREETEDAIVQTARRQRATVVVLDGYQGMIRSLPGEEVQGAFLYSLGAKLAILGATIVVALEGDVNLPAIYSELTVSDVIIALRQERRGAGLRRMLDIAKVRGSDALIGAHPFVIDTNGISVYPRFESIVQLREPEWTGESASVGIPGIDALLRDGLTVGTSTVLMGVSGTGKTLLAMHFAVAGARAGEPALIVSFHENAVQLRAKARTFGLDLEAAEASGLLRLLILPAYDIVVDRVLWEIRDDIERRGVRRLVIDSVAELERSTSALERTDDVLAALTSYLRSRNVTSVFTLDSRAVVGSEGSLSESPIGMVAENLLYMRLAEYRGQLHRLISVLKMRFSDHDRAIHEYEIRPERGIELLGAVPPAEGWLTGVARTSGDLGPNNGDL